MPESASTSSAPQSTPGDPSQSVSSTLQPTGETTAAERRASIWDALHGLEVRDFTETLPSDVWEQLFPRRDKGA